MFSKLVIFTIALIASAMAASVDFTKNSADFSLELYNKIVKENPNTNVIISPLSVQTAVSLAFMGSQGKTAEEIEKGLRLGTSEKSAVGDNFKELLSNYKDSNVVKIANKIYTKVGYIIKPEFNEIAKNQFNSEVESVDFEKAQTATDTINSWVEEKTNHKITNLIDPSLLDKNTRMILVNAIHFKADWEKKFSKDLTRKHDFHASASDKLEVDMMFRKDRFKYGELDDLKASVLEMNYKDSDLSMLFILPKEVNGLSELEEKLLTKNLLDISNGLSITDVTVNIPKFKIEFSTDLSQSLTSMGMGTMFSDHADFGQLLTSDEPLTIAKAIHKAFIEVDESGAEAAGSTALLVAVPISARLPSIDKYFIADHPFFFAIKSKSNILFSGKFIK